MCAHQVGVKMSLVVLLYLMPGSWYPDSSIQTLSGGTNLHFHALYVTNEYKEVTKKNSLLSGQDDVTTTNEYCSIIVFNWELLETEEYKNENE